MIRRIILIVVMLTGIILVFTYGEIQSPQLAKGENQVTQPVEKDEKIKGIVLPSTAHAETQSQDLPHSELKKEKKIIHVDPKDIHYKDQVAVLVYHNIDEKESTYTISPLRFHEQMKALKDNHYNVISVEDFIDFLNNKGDVPPNAVVITFDDGYESVFRYAYPELKKQGFTATTFLIVSYVESYSPWLPYLKWNEIKEMKQNGFSFYSHTYNLHLMKLGANGKQVPDLANRIFLTDKNRLETEDEYKQRVRDDLQLAEKVLKEKLNNTLSLLCFPFGAYNSTLMDIAEQVGIHYFFTGVDGINTRGNHKEIFRIDAGAPYINTNNLIKKLNSYAVHATFDKKAKDENKDNQSIK